jgi:glycosyltransferase involved in cell wall biosynthesis
MKLMIPSELYIQGGIERVMISLLREWDTLTDGIVVLLPPQIKSDFQNKLKGTNNIVYETITWPPSSAGTRQLKLLQYLKRLATALGLRGLIQWCDRRSDFVKRGARLNDVARRHQCTHCLYFITNRVPLPKGLSIPNYLISNDLFWHFAPLTYDSKLVRRYDASLEQWLQFSKRAITISRKTKQDLLTVFPAYQSKVSAVPLASDRPSPESLSQTQADSILLASGLPPTSKTTFFFPSSFSLYKDHLTLLRASIASLKEGQDLRIVLTGKDTDRLAQGDCSLAGQKGTQEYVNYVDALTHLYRQHHEMWQKICFGFGYCDLSVVEALYTTCSCVVMPSQYEGFGLAVSEAIVRGIPVIAADLEVFREQAELYNCQDRIQFFPVGDADALKSCISGFIERPQARLTLEEAQARFGHWTWREVAKQYLDIFKIP